MRGRHKWICLDCKAENWIHIKEFDRRFRPRCTACGSGWLEPSKASIGGERLLEGGAASKEQRQKIDKEMQK